MPFFFNKNPELGFVKAYYIAVALTTINASKVITSRMATIAPYEPQKNRKFSPEFFKLFWILNRVALINNAGKGT